MMGKLDSIVNETLELNIIPDNNIYAYQEKLQKLYRKFLIINGKGYKYISLDSLYDDIYFSAQEIEIIKTRKDLFYLCTHKKALLVSWIIDELKVFFVTNGMPKDMGFYEIYEYLRKVFSLYSINRRNILELLNCDVKLTYEHLIKIDQKLNSTINSMGDLNIAAQQLSKRPYETIGDTKYLNYYIRYILGLCHEEGFIEKPLSEPEHKIIDNVIAAIEETDIEMCRQCFQFPKIITPIIDALNDFSQHIDIQKVRMETLCDALKGICVANLMGRVCSLIKAYTNDAQEQSIITANIGDCVYVSDLERILKRCVQDDNIYLILLNFLKWLQTDLRQLVTSALSNICKNERQIKVVAERCKGATLEEVGQHIGVTRERIRQIELKAERSFINLYSRFRLQYVVLAFSDLDFCFNSRDIYRVFGNNADIFTFYLKKSGAQSVIWSDELSAFIVGDFRWYKEVLGEVDALPEQISSNQIMDVIINIKERLCISIEDDLLRKIISSHYRQMGDIYSKGRITKSDMYKIVIERYYPNGMKLFNDYEMMRFKARLQDIFSSTDFGTDDTRAISARITDFTILCDRGKYILPTAIQIQSDLLDDIHSFIINNDRTTIMFAEIFERYKLQLMEKSNINNRFFLQGVLKYYWGEEFEFSRDTISHGSAEDIRGYIEDFVKTQGGVVAIKEMKEEFLGITDIVLSMALANNSDILQWGFGEYIHASLIDIDESEKSKLKQSLDSELEEGHVSTRALYEHIFALDADFLNNNKIYNHIALFSVYQYLYPDDYAFKRPFISIRGVEGTTSDTIIDDYISSFDELTITQLKAYMEDKYIKIMNLSAIIDNNCSDFLRVDEDLLVRATKLSIAENTISDIEDSVLSVIGDKGYISAKYFDGFFFFPYIGAKWTPYLLISFIKKYSTKLAISQYVADYRYINETIVKKSLHLNNHDELIRHALIFEDSKTAFANINDVESFLKTEGIIANVIPQSLYDSGYIIINEFGKVKIV